MRPNDVEARLEDMTALGTAASPDELHTALVLRPPAAFEREHSVPLNYFVRAHERGPAAAVTTAILLVTDPRWVPVWLLCRDRLPHPRGCEGASEHQRAGDDPSDAKSKQGGRWPR